MNTLIRQTLILTSLFLGNCAYLDRPLEAVGSVFKGNTRKTIVDYGLDDKNDYRKYLDKKKLLERDEEKDIIETMDKTKK